jgi:tRNA(Ile)-lysidine synthase
MARRPPAVARVLERVIAAAREHDMFTPGDRVLVAVSGGPDSTCLLYSLHMLRRLFKIKLEVFHFDHRLRPDSAKDAQYVRRMAAELGLPFHLRRAEDRPAKGQSVEAWARTARLLAAASVTTEGEFKRMAFGHTLDDRAETVVIAMVRGTGLDGLAGMTPVWGPMVRPLIDVRRDEVEAFCRAIRKRPRRDPTNDDLRLLRNAVRHRVIPAMEAATRRDVKGPLARTASLLQRDAEELDHQAKRVLGRGNVDTNGSQLLALDSLVRRAAISSRVVRLSILELGVLPSDEGIEAVLDLASGRPGRRRDLPGGLIAVREKEYVRLSRASPGASDTNEKGGSRRERSGRHEGSRVARPRNRSYTPRSRA